MFQSNHLIGFGAANALTSTSLGNTGTNFGDMTAAGGIAAAFDGTTAQAATSCMRKTGMSTGTRAYGGKNYSPAQIIDRVVVYTSTDQGLSSNGAVSCTITLRGMHSVPGSANDAGSTSLGSWTFTDSNSQKSQTITSSDQATAWEYVWLDCAPGGSGPNAQIAEMQIYGLV